MQDQKRATRPGPGSFLARTVASFRGGRSPVGRSGWRPSRAFPYFALGAVGFAAFTVSWPEPEAVAPVVPAVAPFATAELPLEVNERVEKWMRRFLTDQRRSFETFLSREGAFSHVIRGKLRERGMPEELLYLAMIESGFSTRATSRVGAGGVWQFMSPTAKEYGLRVDRWVDERRDPVKATDAALDYLQFLHDRYDSWYLAAAAYNAGFGRVDRALRKNAGRGKGDEDLYWEIIEHLPRETRDYVPKILAATALAREAERYGFHVTRGAAPYEFERVWVPGGTPLAKVAREVGIEAKLLKELNPHLVHAVTPPGASYGLRVPVGSTRAVIAALGGRPLVHLGDD